MFGNNPIRTILKGDGDILEVQEIFETIQGEGPYCGVPSVFLRLGGCNLACNFCDTEFENFTAMKIENIINEIKKLSLSDGLVTKKLVVITGGEPFRQPIERICSMLLDLNYMVQIETNGTLYRELDSRVKIICSPKNNGPGYFQIRDDLLKRIQALKFIISKSNSLYNFVPNNHINNNNIEIYLQPMDEYCEIKNKENIGFVVDLAKKYGYRVSLQTHKILGVR